MKQSVVAPKYRRFTCSECGRVIPWTWVLKEPKRAVLMALESGAIDARCLTHKDAPNGTSPEAG